MIDKLDVRVPGQTPFARELQKIIECLRHGAVGPVRPTRFYRYSGDLRESHDIDAILHLENKFGNGSHKIEVIDAGKKSLAEMQEIFSRIFKIDPGSLEVMRVDLAADIPGIPVAWFRENACFRYKRFASRIEKADETEFEFISMGSAVSESLYAGRRPNCMRIYNKIEEWRNQWKKHKRNCERFNEGMKKFEMTEEQKYYGMRVPPSFERFCELEGCEYIDGMVLTRVERQIGGDRIPPELTTVSALSRSSEYNPFESFEIVGCTAARKMPEPGSIPMRDWLAVFGFRALIDYAGSAQAAVAFIKKYGNGNGKRIIESLAPLLPQETPGITSGEIYENYRISTEKQTLTTSPERVSLPPRHEEQRDQITPRSITVLPGTRVGRWA